MTSHKAAREHLLEALLESTEDAILQIALDGTIETWSHGAERLYGYAPAEVTGRLLTQLMPVYEVPVFDDLLARMKHDETPLCQTTDRIRKDGSKIRVEVQRVAIRDEAGTLTGILERARELNWSGSDLPEEAQLRLLMQQLPGIVWTTDRSLLITSNWGSGLPHSRIRPGNLVRRSICEYLGRADRYATPIAEHYDALQGTSSHFEYKRKNRFLDIHLGPLRSASEEIIGCVGVGLDITERKKTEDDIRYQAAHDALTGLANYREFVTTLEREVRRADRSRHSFTVLLLDLDDLKKINDRYGHLAGNHALKRLAAVMKDHCRSTDLAARYGGDEFAAVLIDSDVGMAENVAQRIQNCLQNDGEQPPLTVSIGVGTYPSDGRTAQELLEAADQQLYRRKKALRRRTVAVG